MLSFLNMVIKLILPWDKSPEISHNASSGATGREPVPVQEKGDEVVPIEPWKQLHHTLQDGVVS